MVTTDDDSELVDIAGDGDSNRDTNATKRKIPMRLKRKTEKVLKKTQQM